MTDDETPTSAAQLRAMAEEAEAEAAAAEALAAAARARARAARLRRQAEGIQAERVRPDEAGQHRGDTAEIDGQPKDDPAEEDTDDAVGAGEENTASAFAVEAAARRSWLRRRLRLPGLSSLAASFGVLVVLLGLVATAYMVRQVRDASQRRQWAAEFAAAARKGVVELTSLDFQNPRQAVQRILDVSTGVFKNDFTKNVDDFTKVVEQSQVIEHGTVNATAVDLDSMTKDSAVVLVASTAEVTNAAGAKQEPRKFKLIVTLMRDGDQIKMSKVEFVP